MSRVLTRIEFIAQLVPHNQPALVAGDQRYSYRELVARVQDYSRQLAALDCQVLALHAQNSIDWVVADLACQEAGIVCIPLPAFFSPQQIRQCLLSSGVQIVLSDQANFSEWLSGADNRGVENHPTLLPDEAFAGFFRWQVMNARPVRLPKGTQKITFTSGSTGTPKGVCLSLEHQWRVAQSLADVINVHRPKHLCLLPLSTLLENIAGVITPLLCGGTVMLFDDRARGMHGSSRLDITRLIACIDEAQPDTMILIPQLLTALLVATGQGWCPPKSLQFVAVGGGKVAPEAIAEALVNNIPVYQGYGLSECGSVVALNTPRDQHITAVGRVLPHCSASIENSEIVVTGATFLGYLDDEASWYPEKIYTGDIGSLENGLLSVEGRKKNLLISSFGRNISPEWVEAALLSKPVLSNSIVFGDGEAFLTALLTAPGAVPDVAIDAWVEQVNKTLPDYARIGKWQRVDENDFRAYCTANGRPQRERIKKAYAAVLDHFYHSTSKSFPRETSMSFYEKLQEETVEQRNYLLSAPIINASLSGSITLNDYVAFLQQAYHHVKHTTPLLMATGARLAQNKEWLREAVAEYIEEELGHQEWILNDIAACGFDKEKARNSQPNLSTELMVSYAYDTVNRVSPLGFFGMVNVLEGTSINIADQAADKIQQTLGLPNSAFTYLRSHGKLDQDHIKFFEGLMNKLSDPEEQALIIHACKAFYVLYGNMFREIAAEQAVQIAA